MCQEMESITDLQMEAEKLRQQVQMLDKQKVMLQQHLRDSEDECERKNADISQLKDTQAELKTQCERQ